MTYRQMAKALYVPFCAGECGIVTRSHEQGFVFLDVVHWAERRFTRRGAKNFLMLVARRRRLLDPEFLNIPEYDWIYEHLDSTMAQRMAHGLGFRIPAHLFDMERNRCARLAQKRGVKLSKYPAIYAWSRE